MNTLFYKNHGHRCTQATIKSILKARLPDRNFTFKELDELTLHQNPQITFPIQIAYGFHQLGIPFEYYTKPNGLSTANSTASQVYFKQHYGKELISNINFTSLNKSIKELQSNKGVIELQSKPSLETLEKILEQKGLPICLVNWDIFNNKPNTFPGHYIIPIKFEKNDIIYHDSGPYKTTPNKKISKNIFQKAWNLSLIDHNLIVA